ncbi:MAG TPA: DEAD/DEAH box helicase, partial [Gammaproteobacteria bacterium]|nr:DEAD/DEAH box helicase [Gammaproteobacteria bacterium]
MPGQNSNKDFPLWAAERFLSTPCVMLKGVGPKVADKLQKLGIYKIRDLLFHLPTRYEDKTRVIPFSDLKEGQIAVVQGQAALDSQPVANKKLSRFLLTGEGGCLSVIFFHLKPVQIEQIIRQKWLRCYGQVRRFGRNYGLIHPEFEILKDGYQPFPKHYTPVYPSTEGLSQKRINKLVQQALAQYLPLLAQDIIPQNICQEQKLLSFREALQIVHAPPNTIDLEVLNQRSHPAFDRLSVEEMLAYQLVLTQKRMQVAEAFAIALPSQNILLPEFIKQLPFQLTRAQEKAFKEIAQDLDTTRPMRRLLQGDVGSGKTLVAILAALLALENKKQVAFLVPTEILAQQHYRILKKWLAPLGIRLGLLTGQMASDDKKEQMLAVEQGKIQLVIGTHILLQPQFKFLDLGLVIIDEQHRFGVLQRQQLLDQENSNQKTLPHLLMMTATPIPRTLAMIFFSDLRLSIIDSMPPGRKPIQTI